MELSERLRAVADLVTEGAFVADIGTDHGYIPIWLIQNHRAANVIAMDIRKGPLARAQVHIKEQEGLGEQIKTRLSDGLKELKPGEADTVIAAGMGGGLIIRILEEGREIAAHMTSFILQPQSEIGRVRRYLNTHGYRIAAEDMKEENGKYYSMMKAVHGEPEDYTEAEYLYGKRLLENQNSNLRSYLVKEQRIKEEIALKLEKSSGERAALRNQELKRELAFIEEALRCYKRPTHEAEKGDKER